MYVRGTSLPLILFFLRVLLVCVLSWRQSIRRAWLLLEKTLLLYSFSYNKNMDLCSWKIINILLFWLRYFVFSLNIFWTKEKFVVQNITVTFLEHFSLISCLFYSKNTFLEYIKPSDRVLTEIRCSIELTILCLSICTLVLIQFFMIFHILCLKWIKRENSFIKNNGIKWNPFK